MANSIKLWEKYFYYFFNIFFNIVNKITNLNEVDLGLTLCLTAAKQKKSWLKHRDLLFPLCSMTLVYNSTLLYYIKVIKKNSSRINFNCFSTQQLFSEIADCQSLDEFVV